MDAGVAPGVASEDVSNPISDASLRKQTTPSSPRLPHALSLSSREPWLGQDGEVVWSGIRIALCKVMDHAAFEMCMAAVVMFNIVVIILETDLEALCFPEYADNLDDCPWTDAKSAPWIKMADYLLLALYTVEATARIFVERSRCLRSPWNCLDFCIVTTGWASMVLKSKVNVAFLRFFRIARLARIMKVFLAFRELYLLLLGLLTAMRAIMWGAFMMFALLVLWAIVMVELVHPINSARMLHDESCERCARAFGDVMSSALTLFQTVVAGDSWGTIAVPVIEADPKLAGFFIMALLTISLGLTNLILSVIVERASEARENDMEDKLKQKERANGEQKHQFLKLCKQMDIDRGGTLSLGELLDAYDKLPNFKAVLQMLDIEKDELKAVFKVLDQDGSGDVDYREFCDQLCQIKTRDIRTMLLFIKLNLSDLRHELDTVRQAVVDRDVVERVREARGNKLEEKLRQERATEEQKQQFLGWFQQMDMGLGGTLSLSELLDAYDRLPVFRSSLQLLDIEKDELQAMFKVLDSHDSGEVDYRDFCDQICKIRAHDTRTVPSPLTQSFSDLKEEVALMRKSLADRDIVGSIMTRIESSGVLRQHGKLLESIEDKFNALAKGNPWDRETAADSGNGLRLPRARPQPLGEAVASGACDNVRPPGADRLPDDVLLIEQQTQELAGTKGAVVPQVDEHVATTTQQVEALRSLGASLRSEVMASLRHVEAKFQDGPAV